MILQLWQSRLRPFFYSFLSSSHATGFLCFGLFRALSGKIGREGFTLPTRSRASARTSFF